jgi:phage-related protein
VSTIGYATLPIIPSLRGMDRQIQSQLGGLNAAASQAGSQAGESLSSRFGGAVRDMASSAGRVLEDMFTGVAVVGSGVLAASLLTGFQRFTALENASKMLEQMGLSAEQSNTLMDALNDTLTGTAFGLDAGASALANFVSAGADLGDIPGLMDQVTDAAAFGQAELSEVANVWQRILLNGRVTNRELQMLTFRNIPAYSVLASAMGITESAVFDLAMAGELSAEMFFEAWDEGAKGFGDMGIVMEGAAQSMGDTTQGALANMRTAIARFGATGFAPIFEAIRPVATAIQGTFSAITPRVAEAMQGIADLDIFQRLIDWFERLPDAIGPAIDRLRDLAPLLAPLGAAFAALGAGGLARALGPFGAIIPTISPALAAFVAFVVTTPELREAFGRLGEALGELMASLGEALLPLILRLAEVAIPFLVVVIDQFLIPVIGFLTDNSWLAVVAMGAVVALAKPVLGAVGLVFAAGAAVKWVYDNVSMFRDLVDGFVDWVNGEARPAIEGMEDDLAGARPVTSLFTDGIEERVPAMEKALGRVRLALEVQWTNIAGALEAIWDQFGDDIALIAGSMWDTVAEIVEGAFQILVGAFDVGLGVLSGEWDRVWDGMVSVVTGAFNLITAPTRLMMRVMQDVIGAALGVIDEKWRAVWYLMPGVLIDSLSAAVRAVAEKLNEIVRMFSVLPAWIVTVVGAAAHQLVLLGQAIVAWIVRGINSLAWKITEAILNAIPGADSVINRVIDILPGGPSQTTEDQVFYVRPDGRAAGGPVAAGVPYFVGERGMELFVPRESGTIVPNDALERRDGLYIENLHIGTHDDLIEARSKLAMLAIQMGA